MNADQRATTHSVLLEVFTERMRQDAKWGQQDHPSVNSFSDLVDAEERADEYGILSEAAAKEQCERRFAAGVGTYADIAIEEVAEAVCAEDDAKRRAELVQCAAVFVAWIEAIDRRNARALDSVSMDPPADEGGARAGSWRPMVMTEAGLDRLGDALDRMFLEGKPSETQPRGLFADVVTA